MADKNKFKFEASVGGFKIDQYGEAKLTLIVSQMEVEKMAKLGQQTERPLSVSIVLNDGCGDVS